MVIFTPLDLSKIEPDDWEVFWDIWNKNADFLKKKKTSWSGSRTQLNSNNYWLGLDIYKPNFKCPTSWEAPFYDISKELPNLYKSIKNLSIPNIMNFRIVQSQFNFNSHSDQNLDKWEIRGYLHFTSTVSQWYLTRPYQEERTYISLPKETMWFSYNDKYAWHGTDYDANHKKLLIQVFYFGDIKNLVDRSISKYQDYTIKF